MSAELDAATPDAAHYDERRWQSEERRLAILGAIPAHEQPAWRDDWRPQWRKLNDARE